MSWVVRARQAVFEFVCNLESRFCCNGEYSEIETCTLSLNSKVYFL